MIERRHLLVVGSQCERMAPLTLLESAAAELHDVLIAPEMGACGPGLPNGRSIRVGTLAVEEVRADIRSAIEYAEKEGATLVLALLGHGFVPGNTSDLHLLVGGSREGDTLSSVSVSAIFGDAVDRLGLNGVIGIVDTCSAAGAIPELSRLLQGNVGGRTRIALLMAAAVQQSAVEFRLARGLAGLLRSGVLGGDRVLDMSTVHKELNKSESGHRLVKFDYDGSLPGSPIWLGYNRQHRAGAIGRPGRMALANALARLSPPRACPAAWSVAALKDLQRELVETPEALDVMWALRIVDSVLVAMCTTDLLHSLIPEALDSRRLRRAMAASGALLPGATSPAISDVAELVEQVALSYPATDQTCREQVARFVMALLGIAGKPFDAPEIGQWARTINATVQVNDAVIWAKRLNDAKRLRLIVSLHASNTGDWPEMLETWLLLDGKIDDEGRHRIFCTADKPGVEAAIVAAVDKAEDRAETLGLRLERIDVAVPSKLLLEWQPEKIERGEWIGADFTVVMRWSERLNPPEEVRRLHRSAIRRLDDIVAHVGDAPVHWLDHRVAHDLSFVREKLVRGSYRGAIALDRIPAHGDRLFSLLLAHVPILLWPQPTCEHPIEEQDCLDVCWDRMPDELIVAYRRVWRDEANEPIAKLRAVWDDEDWLDFCRSYQRGISG